MCNVGSVVMCNVGSVVMCTVGSTEKLEVRRQDNDDDDNRLAELTEAIKSIYKPEKIL
jgi:hypothetical protein